MHIYIRGMKAATCKIVNSRINLAESRKKFKLDTTLLESSSNVNMFRTKRKWSFEKLEMTLKTPFQLGMIIISILIREMLFIDLKNLLKSHFLGAAETKNVNI